MENKNNSTNTLIKIIVILGALAAIFVAAMLIYKKYNKKRVVKESDPFNFDDDFFFDDCDGCYDGDGLYNEIEEDTADDEADEGLAF
ncbi:MAG: hypothetical protein IKT46_01550 [Clostridia bacterium]|nr:hypothetical protein [Clostridia bacterium]